MTWAMGFGDGGEDPSPHPRHGEVSACCGNYDALAQVPSLARGCVGIYPIHAEILA
jgi:hypothetical protein